MNIAAITFRLHAPWVRSLKEKRMIVKSLIAKLQNKYHVSAAEIDEQDTGGRNALRFSELAQSREGLPRSKIGGREELLTSSEIAKSVRKNRKLASLRQC